jgi:ubiquinone biosynthesis protein Coq4
MSNGPYGPYLKGKYITSHDFYWALGPSQYVKQLHLIYHVQLSCPILMITISVVLGIYTIQYQKKVQHVRKIK